MTVLLGGLLGAGLVLILSPWLWPAGARTERETRRGALHVLLEEAGYPHTAPRVLVVVMIASAAVSAALVWLVTGLPVLALLAALAGGSARSSSCAAGGYGCERRGVSSGRMSATFWSPRFAWGCRCPTRWQVLPTPRHPPSAQPLSCSPATCDRPDGSRAVSTR